MKIIAKRNANGVVDVVGGVKIKIPKDRSMLEFLAMGVVHDSVYAKDGWVYKDGKKTKKWFTKVDKFNVWGPSLADIPTLEQRRFDMAKRCEKAIRKAWKQGTEGIRKCGVSIIKREGYYARVKYHKDGSVNWAWIWEDQPQPKREHNKKAGADFFKAEKAIERYRSYKYLFNEAFLRAISRHIYKNKLIDDGLWGTQCYLLIVINGREYWFDTSRGIRPLIYPEDFNDKVKRVVIKRS